MPVYPFQGRMPTIADDVFIAPGAMIIGDVTIHARGQHLVQRGRARRYGLHSDRPPHKYPG